MVMTRYGPLHGKAWSLVTIVVRVVEEKENYKGNKEKDKEGKDNYKDIKITKDKEIYKGTVIPWGWGSADKNAPERLWELRAGGMIHVVQMHSVLQPSTSGPHHVTLTAVFRVFSSGLALHTRWPTVCMRVPLSNVTQLEM